MTLHVWLAFVLASALLGLFPGPGVTSIIGYAISSGRRTALAAVAGLALGNGLAMSLSLAGVGTLLAASAAAFTVIKWIGALYLIGLGLLTLWKSRGRVSPDAGLPLAVSPRAAFFGNVAIATFHPKTIIFYVAFVPQFIDARGSYAAQAAILTLTFCAVVIVTDTIYALIASRAASLLRRPHVQLWSQRAGGGVLIAAGLATAVVRK